jgi:PepSY-associated TM region
MSVLTRVRLDWRRAVVYTHRWLGIAAGPLFVAWFVSGIVMMYARMPVLPAGEVSRRLQPIDIAQITTSPAEAARASERAIDRIRITTFRDRAVYRLTSGRVSTTVVAESGRLLEELTPDDAVAVVRELIPEYAATIRHDAVLLDADQWTMGVRAQMPVHRVAVGDPGGSYYYVAQRSGEVVMRTTAAERRWAYPGAVLHWLYFAPFRRQAALWTQTIIGVSIAGCILCIAGLVWGLTVAKRSPYTGLMKWHHYSGLIFGAASLTWVFSGLLSMGPWGWSPGSVPTRVQRERAAGGPLQVTSLTADSVRGAAARLAASAEDVAIKEIDLVQLDGAVYLAAGGTMVAVAQPDLGAFEQFPRDEIERAARMAMPGVAIEDMAWLNTYDNYYYARDGHLTLPVLRVRYADPNRTWLYLDPRGGSIVRKEERLSRVERWLYHGLHSLDFPFLYYHRPLWDVVVIALSIGGIVLSATTLLPGWRRVRRTLVTARSSPSPPRSSADR